MDTKETVGTIGDLMAFFRDMKDRSVTSLSEYTQKTLIASRCYIEDSIAREDGTISILKFVNQLLGGLVFSAVGMTNLVSGGRTVRDMASMISTEDFHNFVDVVEKTFGKENVKIVPSVESLNAVMKEIGDAKDTVDTAMGEKKDEDKGKKVAAASEIELKNNLFCGRLVEVTIGGDKGKGVPFYFYVQILPFITPTTVLEQFITTNYRPDLASRWAKFKTGEISFWKDFIFETDLVKKRQRALKADKDGILREMEDRKQNQIKDAAAAMSPIANKKHNTASSIILVSRRTIERIMKDAGLDYRRYDVRQKILNTVMGLMLVVYDPNYGTCDVYLNGIRNPGNYSVDQITKSVDKGGNKDIDLKTLMTMLGSGSMPRF